MSSVSSDNDSIPQPASPRAAFPPPLINGELVGRLVESDGKEYPRKFGCSSTLGDIPVFLFGDVYALEPGSSKSKFINVATSAASFGSYDTPLVTSWPYPRNGSSFHNVPDLWVRSPILELPIGGSFGVVFFTKARTNDDGKGNDEHRGVGVAEVQMMAVGKGKGREGDPEMVIPVARRHGNLLFDDTGLNSEDPSSCPIFLCRVPHRRRAYLSPQNYTFWDGRNFVQSSAEQKESLGVNRLQPVMFGLSSGTIFHTTLFSHADGEGKFIMVGSDRSHGARVLITHSDNIWGPWTDNELLLDLELATGNPSLKASAYIHLWASDLVQGRLFMSWEQEDRIETGNVYFAMAESDNENNDGNVEAAADTRASRGSSNFESLLRNFNAVSTSAQGVYPMPR